MRLDEIKQSFIKYLLEHNAGNKALEEETEDIETFSIFDHASDFKKFLETQDKAELEKFSINVNDINKVAVGIMQAISKEEQEIEEESSEETIAQAETFYEDEFSYEDEFYSEFFGDENVVAIFDSDGNSELSEDEITTALTNIGVIDGNKDDITIDDFMGLSEYINGFQKTNPKLEGDEFKTALVESLKALDGESEALTEEDFAHINDVETKLEVQNYQEVGNDGKVSPTANTKLSSQNTHASNYTGPSGELKSTDVSSNVVSTDGDIADLEKKIEEQNQIKADAVNASSEYFAQNQYTDKLSNLNTLIDSINTYNSTITTLEADLHTIKYDISASQAELENLADPAVFTEYQEEIDKRRQELSEQISALQQQQTEKEAKLSETKTALEQANADRDTLEKEIKEIEENNPDKEAQKVIDECNKNITDLKQQIDNLKTKKESEEQELAKQREQEIKDSEVYGAAQAYRQNEFVKFMMDTAIDPKTKEYYDKWYYENMNGGAYCAVFTSEMSEYLYSAVIERLGINPSAMNVYGDQNNSSQGLTGDQMSMSAAAWGEKIQPALDALGLNARGTIDVTGMTDEQKADLVRSGKVYPGMTWEYSYYENGKLCYHTGFVESINKDLSWNTIEGNTVVKYDDGTSENHTVGSHKKDGLTPHLSSFTDSTLKALIWAYQAGKITEEQMKNLTYSAYYSRGVGA